MEKKVNRMIASRDSRSRMLAHLFHKAVKTSVILGLRDGAALQKQIQRVLLSQKELMILFFGGQTVPCVIAVTEIHRFTCQVDFVVS